LCLFVAAAFVAVFVSLSSSPTAISVVVHYSVSFDRYLMVSVVLLFVLPLLEKERPKVDRIAADMRNDGQLNHVRT